MTVPAAYVPLSKLPGFSPREAAVHATDSGLRPLPAEALTLSFLRSGVASAVARGKDHPEGQPQGRSAALAEASVLVPIVTRKTGATVLLTVRSAHLSNNGGQIAFPGGRRDEGDIDAAHTALREAREEVGLAPEDVEVVGQLAPLVSGGRFMLTPVIGLVDPDHQLRINADEVADAFEVPLAFLMDPGNHRRHIHEHLGTPREWRSVLYLENGIERLIWGATANIVQELYRALAASLPD